MSLSHAISPRVDLRASLERALSQDALAVERLGGAGTSVTFGIAGGETCVTLLLDADRPSVCEGDGAEIRIELDADAEAEFVRGRLVMSTCLLEGQARSWGPVRRYLTVDPILRGLLARADGAAPGGIGR